MEETMKRIIKSEFFIAVSLIITIMFIASCDFSEFAIPESVTIKGDPGVYIPLGSPFTGENADIIERYIGTDSIREMMGGATGEGEDASPSAINIYEYAPPGSEKDAKTFIIHYPIAKMPYDLGQYMDEIYNVESPKITGIDLRRPEEAAKFFPNKTLSELTELTDAEVRNAVDAKIDEWVDKTANDEPIDDLDMPLVKLELNNFSNALKVTPSAQKPQLIAQTKTNVKALPTVVFTRDLAVSGINTLKKSAEEMRQKKEINLGDMAKLVKYIEIKDTKLKVEGTIFENKIEVAIPQFGIGSVNNGVVTYASGKVEAGNLYFTTNPALDSENLDGDPSTYRFTIDNKPSLDIYVNVIDFIDEGPVDFTPTLVFNWTRASVDPGEEGKLSDTYEMNFGNITDFLGDDFELPPVWGYLYVSNLPISKGSSSKPTMELSIESKGSASIPLTDGGEPMEDAPAPVFSTEIFVETLPDASLDPIDMTAIFEAKEGASLRYTVVMGDKDNPLLLENNGSLEGEISADMVVVIPLEFKIKTASPILIKDENEDVKKYVSLELKDDNGKPLLPEIEGDIFGRDGKGGTIDEVIGYIGGVKIKLEDFVNEALPNIAIWIKAGANEYLLDLSGDSDRTISFEDADVKYPFEPKFKILIPCDEGENYGTLKIGKKFDFDFNLVVEAKANLDIPIDF
jgi:hypothetical protein